MSVKMRSNEEVELNLASMLDMAFQLLAFFILTFQSPAAESKMLLMQMPPPQAAIVPELPIVPPIATTEVKPVTTLMVNVGSCAGRIDGIEVGVPSLAPMKQVSFNELNGELARFFQAPGTPFEQVVVRVSPELHYGELMRVVDVCASQRLANHELLKKLSFEELGSRR